MSVQLRPPERVWLESHRPGPQGRSFAFEEPVGQVVAAEVGGVAEAVAAAEEAVRRGLHVVAALAYEAAPAFDSALAVRAGDGLPPAWFGFYRSRRAVEAGAPLTAVAGDFELGPWTPALSRSQHGAAVARIRDYIAAGDVYQVNLTFPLGAAFAGDASALYRRLCRAQGNAAFCAFLDLGPVALLSTSPELFVALDGDGAVMTRPMKGTRRRGRWRSEDEALARQLAASDKERAENAMIVDLLRSDLGRVAAHGTVRVADLWRVEAYDTVWQLTSTVECRLRPEVGLAELLSALFPCGSVTGAPKVRACQVIAQLEVAGRGAYTGAIGFLSPVDASAASGCGRLAGVEARLSVAIRTVAVDRAAGRATAGVGGGITWDSDAGAEYEECLDKARFLELVRGGVSALPQAERGVNAAGPRSRPPDPTPPEGAISLGAGR